MHGIMLKYVQAFLTQTAHTAISNARSHIDQRLARWVLMAHDRGSGPTIALTHEFLALMLGVRRAGVTQALNALVKKVSSNLRADEITVLDRKGLKKSAGDCTACPRPNTAACSAGR